jgi:ADP-ribose pyrophosphatase YjhB (NUDIX family)
VLVKVHALVWVDGGIVVHEERRQGEPRLTLPGGRVRDREPLGQALRRELGEELGADARIGALRYVAEVVHGHTAHELTLVFASELLTPLGPETLVLDPRAADGDVFPPILGHVAEDGPAGPAAPRWLGNIWVPGT